MVPPSLTIVKVTLTSKTGGSKQKIERHPEVEALAQSFQALSAKAFSMSPAALLAHIVLNEVIRPLWITFNQGGR
jgi:hypothetical protein